MGGGGYIDESTGIKKGPWTAEEDQVLINFVNKNGPRDWSSIRSMGLLPRTGKSCRLRWVNKLRPNLKIGCKFTAEEERMVVELQGRFGNKWATIASYLSGRTDNDVKNFWSSRQKRLARILMNSSQSSNKKCQKQSKLKSHLVSQLPSNLHVKVPESSNSIIQVTQPTSKYHPLDPSSLPTSNTEPTTQKPGPIGPWASPILSPKPIRESPLQDSLLLTQLPCPTPLRESPSSKLWLTDHQIKDLVPLFSEPIGCLELFPCPNGSELDVDFGSPFFGGLNLMEGSCSKQGDEAGENLAKYPDGFFDDFPTDVFDCLDPLPSSSEVVGSLN